MDQALGSVAAESEPEARGTVQPGSIFFLEQVLGYDADKRTIIDKTLEQYPPDLLTSDSSLYILIDLGQVHPYKSGILAVRTREFVRSQSLDGFVHRIEAEGKGVVVSFCRDDFDRFSAVVGQKNLWDVYGQLYQGRQCKVHKYGNPPSRKNGV